MRAFTQLVFGTNRGMGLDCQSFLRTLANKLSTKNNEPNASFISWLRIQLSFAILRTVHRYVSVFIIIIIIIIIIFKLKNTLLHIFIQSKIKRLQKHRRKLQKLQNYHYKIMIKPKHRKKITDRQCNKAKDLTEAAFVVRRIACKSIPTRISGVCWTATRCRLEKSIL